MSAISCPRPELLGASFPGAYKKYLISELIALVTRKPRVATGLTVLGEEGSLISELKTLVARKPRVASGLVFLGGCGASSSALRLTVGALDPSSSGLRAAKTERKTRPSSGVCADSNISPVTWGESKSGRCSLPFFGPAIHRPLRGVCA